MLCKKCLIDKAPSAFYSSNRTRCKDCVKASVSEYRQANLERIRAYDRMRSSQPHRVAARAAYRETGAYAVAHAKATNRWAASNPVKRKAHAKLNNAVRDGKVIRKPCERCGATPVEAHHPDYARPLEVVWLCPTHHHAEHTMERRP